MAQKILPFSAKILESIAEKYGTPTFVTNADILRERVAQMNTAFPMKKKILYAIKANSNPAIVKVLKDAGIGGIDTVSTNEVRLALEIGFDAKDIIFTGNNPSDEDMRYVTEKKVLINAGSLSEIERFGKIFPRKNIAIRINPGVGAGLSEKVITGGEKAKFGIIHTQFEEAKALLKKYNLHLTGIHAHVGSGFYTPDEFIKSAKMVLKEAENFENLEFVDFGGGFGIPYKEEESHINLPEFGKQVQKLLDNFAQKNGREIEMRIEPGRFLVAESTLLLATVTTLKKTPTRKFVGLNTGMNHLVRPAMYGSYHHILNISNIDGKTEKSDIVGNICESSDIFGREREIAKTSEGDLIAILDAGAYGNTLSSNCNLHGFAAEVLVDGDKISLTRKRQTYQQMLENFVF